MLSAAIVYDRNNNVCAYYVGVPKEADDGTLTVEFKLCSYDITDLTEQETMKFNELLEDAFSNEVKPEDVMDCGAKYFYPGVGGIDVNNMFRDTDWYKLNVWMNYNYGTKLEQQANIRKIDTIENLKKRNQEGHATFCMLLDKNKEPIGYTFYS